MVFDLRYRQRRKWEDIVDEVGKILTRELKVACQADDHRNVRQMIRASSSKRLVIMWPLRLTSGQQNLRQMCDYSKGAGV
ncbi:hypothetical protein Leryth_017358 [Lithospermum erythrorhizon]|nr:hypothetical protein Leryth_017358 [Lithospermum erythrorhizon]